MNTYKIYLPLKEKLNGSNYIKFSLSFNKETYHWATSSTKQKGYQVSSTPISKGEFSESFSAFNGFYEIILPYERQSEKRRKEAIALLEELIKTKYKDYYENRGYVFEKSL